jgi:hypothetical protein
MSQKLIGSFIEHKDVNWCSDKILDIIKEIKESNGKISNVINEENLIKVMSKISNYVRYDVISKNEIVTYKVSNDIYNEALDLFS